MSTETVAATLGYGEALAEPRYWDPIRVSIVATVYLNDREASIEQALALADAIHRVVATCRSGSE